MFVVITDPSSDEVLYSRRLAPNEVLTPRHYAEKYARACGVEIDHSDGYVPSCSGDIRVELRPRHNNSVVIWSGESFFYKL